MQRFWLALLAAAGSLCFVSAAAPMNPSPAQVLPPAAKTSRVHITDGPAPERVETGWAILRWTSNNPGGADEHFAIAHYGTDPQQLNQAARSHIRLNRNHPETVFRVMLTGLKPKTTYYYTVDSMGGDGVDDHVKSPELHFTTP
jgi:Purple acid Phosphatase, N-terminal domain